MSRELTRSNSFDLLAEVLSLMVKGQLNMFYRKIKVLGLNFQSLIALYILVVHTHVTAAVCSYTKGFINEFIKGTSWLPLL